MLSFQNFQLSAEAEKECFRLSCDMNLANQKLVNHEKISLKSEMTMFSSLVRSTFLRIVHICKRTFSRAGVLPYYSIDSKRYLRRDRIRTRWTFDDDCNNTLLLLAPRHQWDDDIVGGERLNAYFKINTIKGERREESSHTEDRRPRRLLQHLVAAQII